MADSLEELLADELTDAQRQACSLVLWDAPQLVLAATACSAADWRSCWRIVERALPARALISDEVAARYKSASTRLRRSLDALERELRAAVDAAVALVGDDRLDEAAASLAPLPRAGCGDAHARRGRRGLRAGAPGWRASAAARDLRASARQPQRRRQRRGPRRLLGRPLTRRGTTCGHEMWAPGVAMGYGRWGTCAVGRQRGRAPSVWPTA